MEPDYTLWSESELETAYWRAKDERWLDVMLAIEAECHRRYFEKELKCDLKN